MMGPEVQESCLDRHEMFVEKQPERDIPLLRPSCSLQNIRGLWITDGRGSNTLARFDPSPAGLQREEGAGVGTRF